MKSITRSYPKTENACFDRSSSLALKGIAILLMIFHHNFRNSTLFERYDISFFPFRQQQVVDLAFSCKICVSIFAFISGYGLFLSFRDSKMNGTKWAAKRYVRTFSGYWFVWIAGSVISQIIDGRTLRILCSGNISESIANMIIDFLGLANLFRTPSVNGTWWYMSAAAVFTLLTPFLYKYRDDLPLIVLLPLVFIRIIFSDKAALYTGDNSVYVLLIPFILGSVFAHFNCFEKWLSVGQSRLSTRIYKCIAEIYVLIVLYKLYRGLPMESFWELHFGLYPIVFIMFCVEYILPFTFVKNVLMFLGKHSMNIFLVHTFIRAYYLADFTYSWKHFAVICLVLLMISIAISIVIEKAKDILHYNKMIDWIISR